MVVVATLVALTIVASAVALSSVGGKAATAASRTSSSGLAAAEITPLVPTKVFSTLTSLFAAEARRLARHHTPPAVRHPRNPRTRKPTASRPVIHQAAATPVVSTPPPSSASSSSTSAPTPSTQSATSESAPTTTTQNTQPAFGQNGSLGPGRGAAGTQ
jgi:hypothetical protein